MKTDHVVDSGLDPQDHVQIKSHSEFVTITSNSYMDHGPAQMLPLRTIEVAVALLTASFDELDPNSIVLALRMQPRSLAEQYEFLKHLQQIAKEGIAQLERESGKCP